MVERSETSGGIGKPVQRKEDGRLLTGKGVYVADVWLPNTAYAWMVRSPHAHARIRAIDISAAMKSPGVIAVFTGKDLLADGLHLMDHKPSLVGPPDVAVTVRPGFDTFIHAPADAAGRQGAPCRRAGRDRHRRDDRPGQGRAPSWSRSITRCCRRSLGPRDAAASRTRQGLGRSRVQSRRRCRCRQQGGDRRGFRPGRACRALRELDATASPARRWSRAPRVGDYDPRDRRYTLYAGTGGGVARERGDLASVLGVPRRATCACVCGDMGGNFGTRNFFFPEYAVLPWAAKKRRPAGQVAGRAHEVLSSAITRAAT